MPAGVFSAVSFAEKSTGCRADAQLTLLGLLNIALTTISANHLLFPTLTQTDVRSGNLMILMPISFSRECRVFRPMERYMAQVLRRSRAMQNFAMVSIFKEFARKSGRGLVKESVSGESPANRG